MLKFVETRIKVERIGTRAEKAYHQVAYYISSLVSSATDFAQGIRGHWRIENSLHWVKDVIFHEDHSRIRMGNAPENLSVMRTMPSARLRQRTQYFAPKWLFFHHRSPKIYRIMMLTNSCPLWNETALPPRELLITKTQMSDRGKQ